MAGAGSRKLKRQRKSMRRQKEQDHHHQQRQQHLDLPEPIVALLLSHLSPRDVARLSLVNKAFRDAASCDLVWERLLPPSYPNLLKLTSAPHLAATTSKKDLYDQLCRHNLLDKGKNGACEGFWIHRPTGMVCHSYSAKSLAVTWGSTAEYWEWSPKLGARFEEVAHLKMVCWLELSGSWKVDLAPGTYTVSWRLQLDSDAFGWDKEPVRFCVSTLDGKVTHSSCYLVDIGRRPEEDSSDEDDSDEEELGVVNRAVVKTRKSNHNWLEYDVGELVVEADIAASANAAAEVEMELFFSMQEIASGTWKGGLFIDGIVLQPICIL